MEWLIVYKISPDPSLLKRGTELMPDTFIIPLGKREALSSLPWKREALSSPRWKRSAHFPPFFHRTIRYGAPSGLTGAYSFDTKNGSKEEE